MAYIGKQPVVGNFQVCDAISVVNGQAAYTMQVSSTNVEPENANHMLVSLNGVLQKPGSSFTISGATITFASNLATGDVIDFIILLGDVLNIGQPSDDTVTAAKLATTSITGQTAETSAADADTILIHDNSASALRKMTRSNFLSGVGGTNTPSFLVRASTNQTVNDSTATQVTFGVEYYDTANGFTSNTYTVPSGQAGKYHLYFNVNSYDSGESLKRLIGFIYKNDSSVLELTHDFGSNVMYRINVGGSIVLDLSVGDTLKVYATLDTNDSSTSAVVGAGEAQTYFGGYKLIE